MYGDEVTYTRREKMSNREHLFRGKRKDNGEWVAGHLLRYEDGRARIVPSQTDIFCYENDENIIQTIAFEVIPETVGEWTGLRDKNGKRIFEGDIVKTTKYGKVIGHSNVNDYDIFQIVYEPAVFRLTNNHRGFNLVGNPDDYEVISNIYDNPELLEV